MSAITSLAVTVNGTTKTYDVSAGLPGTLGIKTTPGSKEVDVLGRAADGSPVARGSVTCSAAAGKVVPGTVKGLSQVVGLSCGDIHTCAVVSGGKVYCWGNNDFGQLGYGSSGGDIASPALVTGFGP